MLLDKIFSQSFLMSFCWDWMSFELLQIKWMFSGFILIWYLCVLSVRPHLLFGMKDWFPFSLAPIILLNSNYSCITWISELGLKKLDLLLLFNTLNVCLEKKSVGPCKLIKMHEVLFLSCFHQLIWEFKHKHEPSPQPYQYHWWLYHIVGALVTRGRKWKVQCELKA